MSFFTLFYKIGKLFQIPVVNFNDINAIASDKFGLVIGEVVPSAF